MIEVFEPEGRDERLVFAALAKAKETIDTTGSLVPVAFIVGADDSLGMFPMIGDWGDPRMRDGAANFLRDRCAQEKATFFAMVTDTWRTRIGKRAEAEAAGLDPSQVKQWTVEQWAQYEVDRREALYVWMESLATPHRGLVQYYKRDTKGRAVWEEMEIFQPPFDRVEGRFMNMLPRPGAD
jgi:hypothetical protein